MKTICSNCGSLNSEVKKREGTNKVASVFVCLFLSLFVLGMGGFISWLIFTGIWVVVLAFLKPQRYYSACSKCNHENTCLALNTPKAMQLVDQYYPNKYDEIMKAPEPKKPWFTLY